MLIVGEFLVGIGESPPPVSFVLVLGWSGVVRRGRFFFGLVFGRCRLWAYHVDGACQRAEIVVVNRHFGFRGVLFLRLSLASRVGDAFLVLLSRKVGRGRQHHAPQSQCNKSLCIHGFWPPFREETADLRATSLDAGGGRINRSDAFAYKR